MNTITKCLCLLLCLVPRIVEGQETDMEELHCTDQGLIRILPPSPCAPGPKPVGPPGPAGAPAGPLGAPAGPPEGPTETTEGPAGAPEGPTGATEGPTGATARPTGATEGPAGAPEGPTGATEGPTGATEGPTGATEGPTGAPEGLTEATEGPTEATEGPPGVPAKPAPVPTKLQTIQPPPPPTEGPPGAVQICNGENWETLDSEINLCYELCGQEEDNDEENTQPSRSMSVVNTVITETITTTVEAQSSTAPPSSKLCQPNQSMISIQPCQLITGRGTGKPSSDGRNSTIALGVLSAILFLIMVAVIAGWIVTCFALKKKKAKSTKESSQTRSEGNPTLQMSYYNLVHNTPHNIPQATFYSSLGPDYEVLDNRRPQQQGIPIQGSNRETTTENDYHVLEQKTTDHTYQVLERGHGTGQPAPAVLTESKDNEVTVSTYEVPVTFKKKEDK